MVQVELVSKEEGLSREEEEEMGLRKRFNTVDLKWHSVVGDGFLKMETDSDIEVVGLVHVGRIVAGAGRFVCIWFQKANSYLELYQTL